MKKQSMMGETVDILLTALPFCSFVHFARLKSEFKHGRLYIHAFQEEFMHQNQLDKLEAVSGGAALALTRLEGDLLHYKVPCKAPLVRRRKHGLSTQDTNAGEYIHSTQRN
jgi:hypothetical protein